MDGMESHKAGKLQLYSNWAMSDSHMALIRGVQLQMEELETDGVPVCWPEEDLTSVNLTALSKNGIWILILPMSLCIFPIASLQGKQSFSLKMKWPNRPFYMVKYCGKNYITLLH